VSELFYELYHTGRLDWALVPAKPAQRLNTNDDDDEEQFNSNCREYWHEMLTSSS
jgi:hypothetical protein